MPNWTLDEFLYDLEQDVKKRVLFVEGKRDMAFWRELIPPSIRGDTVIYQINELEISNVISGGERGRLMWCAKQLSSLPCSDRVRFFADADGDRLLNNSVPENVWLTDGRDLEGYAQSPANVQQICSRGFPEIPAGRFEVIQLWTTGITRSIGVLRTVSARLNLDLPFQRTLQGNGRQNRLKRFLIGSGIGAHLDLEKIGTTLLQNASIPLPQLQEVMDQYNTEKERLSSYKDLQVVHGKDYLLGLSVALNIDVAQTERLLFTNLDYNSVLKFPNINRTKEWVLNQHEEDTSSELACAS